MQVRHSDTTFVILAGGEGRRMGGEVKGLLPFRGVPIVERLLTLAPRFAETFLVTPNPEPYARYGQNLKVVGDLLPGRGSPGGVHAALATARTPWIFAVACDMPCVQPEAVERLLAERADGVDGACFEAHGRLEPLLALYRTGVSQKWGELLGTGQSFRALIPHFRFHVLPEEELRQVDAGLLSIESVNTPAELRDLEEKVEGFLIDGRGRC